MEHIKLSAEARETGKGFNRRARVKGLIPAIVYGKKRTPINVQVPEKDLIKATTTEAGFNALFDLTISGKETVLARIREYQADPIRRNFVHVDFQAVDIKEKIEVEVPVEVIGKSKGIKEGGVLEIQRRTLHLKCFVSAIPDKIVIDISDLDIGQSIHADQIKLPEGVEFPHDTNFTVLGVIPPTKEEEAPTAAAATGVEAAAPAAPGTPGATAGAAPAAGAEAKEGKEVKKESKKEEKK